MIEWSFWFGVVWGQVALFTGLWVYVRIVLTGNLIPRKSVPGKPPPQIQVSNIPFAMMSDSFLKVYGSRSGGTPSTSVVRLGVQYGSDVEWANAFFSSLFHFYIHSHTMQKTIETAIANIIPRTVSMEPLELREIVLERCLLARQECEGPVFSDIVHEKPSRDECAIRFHVCWDEPLDVRVSADVVVEYKPLSVVLPIAIGVAVLRLSGYVYVRIYPGDDAVPVLAISLHPNFVCRIEASSRIGQAHPLVDVAYVNQTIQGLIRRAFEETLIYPNALAVILPFGRSKESS